MRYNINHNNGYAVIGIHVSKPYQPAYNQKENNYIKLLIIHV